MKHTIKLFMGLAFAVLFTACSKDDTGNTPGLPEGKTMKFVLKTSGLQATDDFSVLLSGGDVMGSAHTIFKIDGAAQENQRNIMISKEMFLAAQQHNKEITVETVVPLYTTVVAVSGYSTTAGHSFTFKMTPTVNGEAKTVVTKTIGTTSVSENYSY